jgi:hypothetical protein
MILEPTKYWPEFLRYFSMAETQQTKCNLSTTLHPESGVGDALMEQVHLYDVVERKYAGFSQIVNDCFYGWTNDHPYWFQMESGKASMQREIVAKAWSNKRFSFDLAEWIYVFLVHRLTGSGINYSKKPSGYNNTVLFDLHEGKNIHEMTEIIANYMAPMYTSVGYQFPSFPKVPKNLTYRRGGDYFLCVYAPVLAKQIARFLESRRGRIPMRDIGDMMFAWNVENGLRAYRFQYAAFIADLADWFPIFIDRESMFYYGSNARECIKYLFKKPTGTNEDVFLDAVMTKIYEETGSFPYNAEDCACDFIRWCESYVRPGGDYDHVDRDKVFSTMSIKDHPFGRQKIMLNLGLVDSFNKIAVHPSDDYVISRAGLSVLEYKSMVSSYISQNAISS